MAYKKYIKKGGRIYGPYIYHSRRVDGKVISEYRGAEEGTKNKKFLWIALGIFIVVALVYFSFFPRETLTGRAIVNIEANYQKAEPLEGKLRLSLKEGELLPASSKIVFENKDKTFEYDLKSVISDDPVEGDFYIEGSSVSGTGEGYGISGEKQTSPTVHFILSIFSQKKPDPETPQNPEEISETEENVTEETPEEVVEEAEEIVAEESDVFEEIIEEPAEQEEPSEGEAPITGGVIGKFFGKLTGTGNVVIEFESEVEGSVSAGNVFTYTLQEGETAELKPRSVRTDFEQLSDSEIDINVEGNEVVVTTGYFESEKGFGEEYLGGTGKDLVVDLSKLNLILEPGELKLRLVYGKSEIVSLTTLLGEGDVSASETIPEEKSVGVVSEEVELLPEPEEIQIETNLTIIIISENLTDRERVILISEFGSISLEVKEAKTKNGFIIIRYGLRDYWVEHSYKEELDKTTLESFMERDRIKWLKDIAKRISEQKEVEGEAEEFLGNYSV